MLRLRTGATASEIREFEKSQGLQYFPNIEIIESKEVKLLDTYFIFNETLPWLDQAAPGAAGEPSCSNCATYRVRQRAVYSISGDDFGDYRFFPFDTHEVQLCLSMPGINIFNCEDSLRRSGTNWESTEGMSKEEWRSMLLPSTGDWELLTDSPTSEINGPSMCILTFKIRRNWRIFTVKTLGISVLVVYAGIFSLFMHPRDHTGDRCAQILVACLIIMYNMQQDIGLGDLQYLIWFDYFNMSQMLLLLLLLCETVYVHRLTVQGNEIAAVLIDKISLTITAAIAYPMLLGSLILFGFDDHVGAYTLLGLTVFIVSVSMFVLLPLFSRNVISDRKVALADLARSDPSNEAFEALVKAVYDTFDIEELGSISHKHVRSILRGIRPLLVAEKLAEAMKSMQPFFDKNKKGNIRISLTQLADGLRHTWPILSTPLKSKQRL